MPKYLNLLENLNYSCMHFGRFNTTPCAELVSQRFFSIPAHSSDPIHQLTVYRALHIKYVKYIQKSSLFFLIESILQTKPIT